MLSARKNCWNRTGGPYYPVSKYGSPAKGNLFDMVGLNPENPYLFDADIKRMIIGAFIFYGKFPLLAGFLNLRN